MFKNPVQMAYHGDIIPAHVEMRNECLRRGLRTYKKTLIGAFGDTFPNVDHHCKSKKQNLLL